MAQTDSPTPEAAAPKRSRKGMLVSAALAVALGGASFAATYLDLLALPDFKRATSASTADFEFIALDTIVISFGTPAQSRLLRLSLELEVPTASRAQVEFVHPRILDVINTYLRVIEPDSLFEQIAHLRLRAQLLRRVQMVAGEDNIRDLLITEFVIN